MDDDLFAAFGDDDQEPQTSRSIQNEAQTENMDAEALVSSLISSAKREHPEDSEDQIKNKKSRLEESAALDDEDLPEPKENDQEALNLVKSAPKVKTRTLEAEQSSTGHPCTHEVAIPLEQEYIPLRPAVGEPAKTYPFTLDAFQSQAILCIENNQSVLVSAHTSAGKTVTAEYAIAMSLKAKQRVIYTTPIKALSNQKYREFYEEFSDVGLVTGDVTINPSASCLVMTTEILRSMLYRGSEIMREVGWVIFDEIHYMRDKERGVVWEETIILLPHNVHYVFLSATIPNARQFAEWIAHLHQQPCHVVYTDYRPVPLQHYIHPGGSEGIHLVVDDNGKFREDSFSEAMGKIGGGESGQSKRKSQKEGSDIFKIVNMVMERNFAPVIIFSFSKKECEAYALQMSKLDFNSKDEKKLVDEVFNNAMNVLSEEDRGLPQVVSVLPLLRRGIGIHHGGLLPILKETIEILFGEGLIKALFATETFAMGLNMPARTVVFTNAQKFDGKDMRWITSGEYIQMSGRAGRRGLDDRGIVILMADEKMNPSIGREMVKGAPDPINSAFHLTYNMVLNLLRVEEVNPEFMMERSFHQFQNYTNLPKMYEKVKELEGQMEAFEIQDESEVMSYYRLREQLSNLSQEFQSWLVKPQYLVPFLQAGRLVRIKHQDKDFGYGTVLSFKKKAIQGKNPMKEGDDCSYAIDVLIQVTQETCKSTSILNLMPVEKNEKGVMVAVTIHPSLINQISSVKIFLPKDLKSSDSKKAVMKSLEQVQKRFENVPLIDPIKDMKINEKSFKEIVKKIDSFECRLAEHNLHRNPNLAKYLKSYGKKANIIKELNEAKNDLKKAKSLLQMADLKCMKRVLRRLGYCTPADVIEVKGRIACDLSSADELLLTEMLFNGLFNDMDASQTAAVLSCFVCDERSNEMPKMSGELSGPLRTMQDMAKRIATVSKEAKIEIDEEQYVQKFKPYMMDIVFEWCKGATFMKLCQMTDLFEGSIIRSMRRLEELLRQMAQASKNMGNAELEAKFSECIKLLKRDIVFATSLYL